MLVIKEATAQVVQQLVTGRAQALTQAEERVRPILAAVQQDGDAALRRLTLEFDGVALEQIEVSPMELEEAYRQVEPGLLAALREARQKIEEFHQRQVRQSWFAADELGNITGQLLRPLRRVGLYIPGGTAVYPSSVLMNAIPARVAGVKELVIATPPRQDGSIDPHVLVAAGEMGITSVYRVGGAQAVAALALGTATIAPVDKIVGPGNIYVTAAKRLLYGQVDIDMLAGPSEILVIADARANPVFIAADLLAQAEHDPLATAILVTPSTELAGRVQAEVEQQLVHLPRRAVARQALEGQGVILLVTDLDQALQVADRLAPEHLELAVADPWSLLGRAPAAGAIFLGDYTPETIGDYYAGPSHTLPTGGTARFYSPVGVDTFLRQTSLVSYTSQGLAAAAAAVTSLANVEGLAAHARAVQVRLEGR